MHQLRSIFGHKQKRKGFTVVEVLIAASIFTTVSLISMIIFVNVLRVQRRVDLENMIYEDSRFMMERLSREIRQNTIDYEEYYSTLVEQKTLGQIYGCYASRFYDPGSGLPDDFGAKCNDGTDPKTNPGCTIDKNTLDTNTYQNPYRGNPLVVAGSPDTANALCDTYHNVSFTNCTLMSGRIDLAQQNTQIVQPRLYLINSQGTEKSFIAKKELNATPEYAVALLRVTGKDSDNDGLIDQWQDPDTLAFYCSNGFDCTGLTTLETSLAYNASNNYRGFVPISPSRTDIKKLLFYISPIEDPRKASGESDLQIQQQPHVTVVLTVQPSLSALQGYNGDIPSITLQTTITSRVYNEVKSFLGKGTCPGPGAYP